MTADYMLKDSEFQGALLSATLGACFWCGHPTPWIDVCFEGRLHFECCLAAVEDYWTKLGDKLA